jgi:GNAT superfamily N-acetyltransferase
MTDLKLVTLDNRRMGDFERLHSGKEFGGCFCAVWSSHGEDWEERCKNRWSENLQHTRTRVRKGDHVGFLAYREADGAVVGWTGAGPKSSFPLLAEKSGESGESSWVIACLAIPFAFRGLGYARSIIELVLEQARAAGAKSVETYPVDPPDEEDAYRGTRKLYESLGFSVTDSEALPAPAQEPEPERPAQPVPGPKAEEEPAETAVDAEACVSAGAVASALSSMDAPAPEAAAPAAVPAEQKAEPAPAAAPSPEEKPAAPVKAVPVQRYALRMVKTFA